MTTPYPGVLGERFGLLGPALQSFLGDVRGGRATGRLTVTRAPGRLRNLVATALGLPPAGEYDVVLDVTPHCGGQRWRRRLGRHLLETTQVGYRGLLVEASGPASIGFELVVEDGGLFFRPRRAWLLGVPLPLWMAPGIEADNRPRDGGGWRVSVRFHVPLLGFVGEYAGDVIPDAAPEPTAAGEATRQEGS